MYRINLLSEGCDTTGKIRYGATRATMRKAELASEAEYTTVDVRRCWGTHRW